MIKAITYAFVWLCIPLLILVAWMAKQETDYIRIEMSIMQAQIAALTMRIDGFEQQAFFHRNDMEKLADKVLNVCITDTPRPLVRRAKK